MTENSIEGVGYSIKGTIKPLRKRYLGKMKAIHREHKDPLNSNYKHVVDAYIPKIVPHQMKPVVQIHFRSGGKSCLMRFENPHALANFLEEIVTTLRSDAWLDGWQRMGELSDNLIVNNELIFDEEVFDMNLWKRAIITDEVQIVSNAKKFDKKTQELYK